MAVVSVKLKAGQQKELWRKIPKMLPKSDSADSSQSTSTTRCINLNRKSGRALNRCPHEPQYVD